MYTVSRIVSAGFCAAVVFATAAEPGFANDSRRVVNSIVGGVGAFIGGVLSMQHGPRPYRPSATKKANASGGNSTSNASREIALASLGADKNLDNILREVTFKSTEASAGSDDSRKFGRKGDVNDFKVDLPTELSQFTNTVQTLASGTTTVGDVSLVTVESTLNDVYDAHEQDALRQFELLRGANNTAEQFKVEILREGEKRLGRFGQGNSGGLVLSGQIKQLLMDAAHEVYVRTFEVAELNAMNRRVIDFDRALYEKGGSSTAPKPAETAPTQAAASDSADDDSYPGSPKPSPVSPANPAPAVSSAPEPVSKMRHITAETFRLAQMLAYDIPFDKTRETVEFLEAYRYRLTRASLDCFATIASGETAPSATSSSAILTPQQAAQATADNRYVDLVRNFQVSIAKQETAGKSADPSTGKAVADDDGICRKAAYRLAGIATDTGNPRGANTPRARDLSQLRAPQPESATWDGSAWQDVDSPGRQP